MIGCRVLPPVAGSPCRRRCSSTILERRLASRRGRQGTGSTSTSTLPADKTLSRPRPSSRHSLRTLRIVLAASAAPRGADGEPDLVASGRPIDGLQHQIESEGELQLADDDRGGLLAVQRYQIAAAHLALDLEAQLFEEALDRQIEARFQGALGP